jgi:hypothetical protein
MSCCATSAAGSSAVLSCAQPTPVDSAHTITKMLKPALIAIETSNINAVPNIFFTVALLIEGFEKICWMQLLFFKFLLMIQNQKNIATRNEVKKAGQNKV